MTQVFSVLENSPNGTVIGYLPTPFAFASDYYTYPSDKDQDGVPAITFNSTSRALIVTDVDELDFEATAQKVIGLNIWLNSDAAENTPFMVGYNDVDVFTQDVLDESVNGTAANDYLVVKNAGSTTVRGLNGNDTLLGGSADDTLIGGRGKDVLSGNSGADSFVIGDGKKFTKKTGVDRITDFSWDDKLVFDRKTFGRRLSFEAINTLSFDDKEKAANSPKTLVYDYSQGTLYFNENGTQSGYGKGGLIVRFSNTLAGDVSIDASDCSMGSALI